jgi:hypothetical protein
MFSSSIVIINKVESLNQELVVFFFGEDMQVRNLIEVLPDEFGRGFLEEVAVVLVGQPEQVGHVGLRQLRAESHLALKRNTKQIKEYDN